MGGVVGRAAAVTGGKFARAWYHSFPPPPGPVNDCSRLVYGRVAARLSHVPSKLLDRPMSGPGFYMCLVWYLASALL